MIGTDPGLPALASAFQEWLDERASEHAAYKDEPAGFEGKLELLRDLQRELFDEGWMRYGWAEEHGGLGGSVLHRGVVVDLLQRNGYLPRHCFEHLDILTPALVRFAQPDTLERLFLPTLRGDLLWCQGFSEPTAGSDLAALRTRAERADGGYRIEGHKIWTSWAKWATHCMFLARTGTPEDRHRGLSAFVVEIDAPGLTVGPIRQSNGHDELAEVFFDGTFVPEAQRIGREGEGWAVAMHILAGERGSYAWLRQCEILSALEALARAPRAAEHTGALGECLMRLLAQRCRSREVMEILARGEEPGPESSVTKVLSVDGEQYFYEVARDVFAPDLDFGLCDDVDFWHEHYLYSRASSVYGGSRQIQLNVIGKLMTSRGVTEHAQGDEDAAAVRQSVREALEQASDGRSALTGLDWWSFAAAPRDAFGRAAFAAWFEAEGAALAISPALAGVRCATAAAALGVQPSEVAFAAHEGEEGLLVCGLDAATRWLVADRGEEVVAWEATDAAAAPSRALDAELLLRVRPTAKAQPVALDAADHARDEALARIGAAAEILGAARALFSLAIRHGNEREQFGQPIARFQAIQHLISECQIEISALEAVCAAALEEWSAGGDPALAAVAKAQAGRDGRAIAQRALQVFGAIGFTEEHAHHRYSRRIHTLEPMLGGYVALRRALGEEIVRTGQAPRGIDMWHPAAAG